MPDSASRCRTSFRLAGPSYTAGQQSPPAAAIAESTGTVSNTVCSDLATDGRPHAPRQRRDIIKDFLRSLAPLHVPASQPRGFRQSVQQLRPLPGNALPHDLGLLFDFGESFCQRAVRLGRRPRLPAQCRAHGLPELFRWDTQGVALPPFHCSILISMPCNLPRPNTNSAPNRNGLSLRSSLSPPVARRSVRPGRCAGDSSGRRRLHSSGAAGL